MSKTAWDLLDLKEEDQKEFDPAYIPPHMTLETATAFLVKLLRETIDHFQIYIQELDPNDFRKTDACLYCMLVFGHRLDQLITINHVEVPEDFRTAILTFRAAASYYNDTTLEDALPYYYRHQELIERLLIQFGSHD